MFRSVRPVGPWFPLFLSWAALACCPGWSCGQGGTPSGGGRLLFSVRRPAAAQDRGQLWGAQMSAVWLENVPAPGCGFSEVDVHSPHFMEKEMEVWTEDWPTG